MSILAAFDQIGQCMFICSYNAWINELTHALHLDYTIPPPPVLLAIALGGEKTVICIQTKYYTSIKLNYIFILL